MIWALQNWRLILFAVVLGAAVLFGSLWQGTRSAYKSYRVEQEAQAQERATETAREKAFNEYNRKRTDEDYRRQLANARRTRLSDVDHKFIADALASGGSDPSAICYGRRELNEELSGWVGRERDRLEGLLVQSLEILASYRACAEWARGLGSLQPESAAPAAPGGDGVARAERVLPR